jgi:outer membrane protein assembly factor BamB
MRFPPTALSLALLAAFAAVSRADDNWPQFRGPNGTGISDAKGLPVKWSEKENVVWKTKIHDKGWSSPVVWGNQVWLTTAANGGAELYAVCVDRDSGKVIHDVKVFDVENPKEVFHPFNSEASPTPAVEEGRVYVHFGSAGTACLDTATGKKLWERRDLPCNHYRGPASSPVIRDGLLYLIFDGFDLQYVAALDKTNGKTVWKKDRDIDYSDNKNGDIKKGYATPAVVDVGGKLQLVCPSAEATIAYDPRTGDELWRAHHGGMNSATPPQYGHGKVFVTSAAGGLGLVAIRPDGKGDVTKSNIAWSLKKDVPTRPCPLLLGDLLYLVSDDGTASCVDAEGGKVVKSRRLGGKFSSSPVCGDGKIYCCDTDEGTGFVVEAGQELKVLAENHLDDGCMATPAISGKALFIRTKTNLYRIEQK